MKDHFLKVGLGRDLLFWKNRPLVPRTFFAVLRTNNNNRSDYSCRYREGKLMPLLVIIITGMEIDKNLKLVCEAVLVYVIVRWRHVGLFQLVVCVLVRFGNTALGKPWKRDFP